MLDGDTLILLALSPANGNENVCELLKYQKGCFKKTRRGRGLQARLDSKAAGFTSLLFQRVVVHNASCNQQNSTVYNAVALSLCRSLALSSSVNLTNRHDLAYLLMNPAIEYQSVCSMLFDEKRRCFVAQ